MTVVLDFAKAYWEFLTAGITLLIALAAIWQSRRAWNRREFLTRVNFGVNYVENDTLKIRTFREADIREILLNNPHGKRLVMRAARQTTLERPFIEMPVQDAWLVLNAVLNEISEQFAAGLLAASMGAPVRSAWYVFGLTCEKDPNVRINKIRVMIVEEELLERVGCLAKLQFERPRHDVRLETLKTMLAIRQDEHRRHNLMRVELALPTG